MSQTKKIFVLMLVLPLAMLIGACQVAGLETGGIQMSTMDSALEANASGMSQHDGAGVTQAVAVLQPMSNSATTGVLTFTRTADGIEVAGTVMGLTPGGEHGFHVHEWGDCRAPDGKSAGGHFNPGDFPHAHPEEEERHAGAMPNIVANDEGVAAVNFVNNDITFWGADSVLGRGMIIHAGPDDYVSQPSGAAGPRVACGIIGAIASE